MSEHYSLRIRRHKVDFHIYSTTRPLSGHGDPLTRRLVNAHARYVCSPSSVAHVPVESETPHVTDTRLVTALPSLDALHTAPPSWRPA